MNECVLTTCNALYRLEQSIFLHRRFFMKNDSRKIVYKHALLFPEDFKTVFRAKSPAQIALDCEYGKNVYEIVKLSRVPICEYGRVYLSLYDFFEKKNDRYNPSNSIKISLHHLKNEPDGLLFVKKWDTENNDIRKIIDAI